MISTAAGARKENVTNTITFISQEHEEFYLEHLLKCRYQDVYHKAINANLNVSHFS